MEFNKDKCKTIHYGHGNQCIRYNIDETILNSTVKEKDLGVIMSSDLKPSAQCVAAANKGMSALRQATRTFKHINIDSFKILYKTYIRPNLEFCISAWCPYMSKDIDVMEKVQRRATRMVPELKHLKYEDRLKKLEIYHLSARRLRGDLIEITTIEMSKHHCKNIVTETDLPCAIINCCCCMKNAIAMHLVGLQC